MDGGKYREAGLVGASKIGGREREGWNGRESV